MLRTDGLRKDVSAEAPSQTANGSVEPRQSLKGAGVLVQSFRF